MSGPKVISIVSLEEIIETCQIWLARVDAEIEEWSTIGRRNSVITKADEVAVRESSEMLLRMLESGQYVQLQKEAPILINRLQTDMDQRLEKAAASHVVQQQITRSLRITASTLMQKAANSGIELPREVLVVLDQVSHGKCEDVAAIELAISQTMSLTDSSSKNVPLQSQVIQDIIAGAKTESLDDWIRRSGMSMPTEKRVLSAEKLISQIGAIDEQFAENDYRMRLFDLDAMTESTQRVLKLDALCLELKRLLEETTRWTAAQKDLVELSKEAEVTGDVSRLKTQFAEFSKLRQSGDINAAEALINQLRQTLDTLSLERSAEKKRSALVQGLSELGYTVNLEMTKVWADARQLVIRNAEDPTKGIELSGDFEAGKCQVRVVAFDGDGIRDANQDRIAEEQWCGSLASLQSRLADLGASLKVEKATAAGAVPLKVVKRFWDSDFSTGRAEDASESVRRKKSN